MARPQRLDGPIGGHEPPVDTTAAVEHAYRFHRAKRRVRDDRMLRQRYAGVRFAFTLAVLVFAFVVLSLTIWNEIQRAFGL
jgi:hypothetical protein